MKRVPLLLATGITGAFFVCASLQPINSTIARILQLGALAAFVLCLWLASSGRRFLRIGLVAAALLTGVFLVLPGREPDAARLRARYLAALPRYVGTTYLWGGERATGIDCSGLPRKALRDALWQEGVATLNPRLLRECARQWWFDASASALAKGYRHYVEPLHEQGKIREGRFPAIQPGDVAITASGVHCLVFLGDGSWIQADPEAGKVAISEAKTSESAWFDTPVSIYRWANFGRDVNGSANVKKNL